MPTPTAVGSALHALLASLREVRSQLEQTQAVLSDLIQEQRAGQANYPAQLAYWASERRMTIALLKEYRVVRGTVAGRFGAQVAELLATLEKAAQ